MKPAVGTVYTGTGLDGRTHTGTLVTMLRGMDRARTDGSPDSPATWAVLENLAGQYAVDYGSLRRSISP